jgi:hypothetical protein
VTRTLDVPVQRDRWLRARAVERRATIRGRSARYAVAAARSLAIMVAILLVVGLMLALVLAVMVFGIVLALSTATG